MKEQHPSSCGLRISPQARLKEEQERLHRLWRKRNPIARRHRRIQNCLLIFIFLCVGTLLALTSSTVNAVLPLRLQHPTLLIGAILICAIGFIIVTIKDQLYWKSWKQRHPLSIKYPWVHPDPTER